MAKALKDILQQAHDRIKGVHASQTSPGSLGKDPGVDYDPKSGDEQDFVAKHSVQKWDEPSGNPNYADSVKYSLDKETKHGYTERKAEKVNESKKAEDIKCNKTPGQTWCPIHEMADCSGAKTIKETEQIDEISKKTLMSYGAKASKQIKGNQPSDPDKFRKRTNREKGITLANKKYFGYKSVPATEEVENVDEASRLDIMKAASKKSAEKAGVVIPKPKKPAKENPIKLREEEVNEVLTKSTTAGETIHDFVHSKNPKFAGKSKDKRKQMALAAYYAKQRNESVQEDLAVPLLGGDQPPRGDSDEAIEMVKTELKALANKAMHLVSQMPSNMHVEPWCQAKIAQAKSMVSDVHDYMIYGDHEEDEQMDTPMTFPNMSVDVNTGRNV